jgi:hypothetical protein
MQISAKVAALFALVFAAMCFWFAIDAFTALPDADPQQVSGGESFAWFWSFLAVVGVAIAWVSWRVSQTQRRND